MKSQWECVLENLGEWVGSFTTVTAEGEPVDDIPSVIKLEGIRDNQAVHLVLTRSQIVPNGIPNKSSGISALPQVSAQFISRQAHLVWAH